MKNQLIDDAFYVEHKQWGTWDSYDVNGKCIVTSYTEDSCINATRFVLKGRQEGFSDPVKVYDSQVSGKL
jgi:hypothetical protein